MSRDIWKICDEGTIWVCGACGKTSKTAAPTEHSQRGWDESCMLNSVLCYSEKQWSSEHVCLLWKAVEAGEDSPPPSDLPAPEKS